MSEIKPGVYQHFKGGTYQVLGVAQHSETGVDLVVYVVVAALRYVSGPQMYARPVSMWSDDVTWPDGSVGPRFRRVGEDPWA